jgi:DNA replication and repair protein RecF
MTISGGADRTGAAPASAVLHHLAARDFRNFSSLDVTFSERGAVLVGENGQGKTNLLEAVAYLQLLRSMRGVRDVDLVRFGADGFHLQAAFDRRGPRAAGVGFQRGDRRKRVRLDGVVPERLSDALGMLPSVMFSPADLELIGGAPAARRRYLDIVLALTSPHAGYLAALQRYRGALARRNAAMREAGRVARGAHAAASVAAWEPALAESGALLVAERLAWVRDMAPRFTELCAAIGEVVDIRMRYQSSVAASEAASDVCTLRDQLLASLEQRRDVDIRRGLTHVGPHRDDLVITMATDASGATQRELRVFGSAGQQRTAAIALRLLEAATYSDRLQLTPVMLLDDPFAELDQRRSARILHLLRGSGLGQTILAVPRASDIPAELSALPRLRVADGIVTPEPAPFEQVGAA